MLSEGTLGLRHSDPGCLKRPEITWDLERPSLIVENLGNVPRAGQRREVSSCAPRAAQQEVPTGNPGDPYSHHASPGRRVQENYQIGCSPKPELWLLKENSKDAVFLCFGLAYLLGISGVLFLEVPAAACDLSMPQSPALDFWLCRGAFQG